MKLTNAQVEAIRKDGRTLRAIAAAYGLSSHSYVNRIKLGTIRKKPLPTLKERFLAKVKIVDGHWLWTGSVIGEGSQQRGRMNINGKGKLASHVSWELFVGPVPPDKWLLHKRECNLALCVWFEHLYLGTREDNTQDAMALGTLHNLTSEECRLGQVRSVIVKLATKCSPP